MIAALLSSTFTHRCPSTESGECWLPGARLPHQPDWPLPLSDRKRASKLPSHLCQHARLCSASEEGDAFTASLVGPVLAVCVCANPTRCVAGAHLQSPRERGGLTPGLCLQKASRGKRQSSGRDQGAYVPTPEIGLSPYFVLTPHLDTAGFLS